MSEWDDKAIAELRRRDEKIDYVVLVAVGLMTVFALFLGLTVVSAISDAMMKVLP